METEICITNSTFQCYFMTLCRVNRKPLPFVGNISLQGSEISVTECWYTKAAKLPKIFHRE